MKKKYRFLFLIPVILLCTLFGCRKEKAELLFEDTEKIIEEDPVGSSGNSEENREAGGTGEYAGMLGEEEVAVSCMVHVCGAVEQPGVYELPQGSRIYQAIECAGGLSAEADPDYLNQADFVSDGEKVYVPTREEVTELDSRLQNVMAQSGETSAPSGLVNLNTASEDQLCTLPGIGSSKAKSIIAYREEHGSFDRIESVMNVAGIKDGLFQKIKAYITV